MRIKRGTLLACLAVISVFVTTSCSTDGTAVAIQGYQVHAKALTIQYPDNPCAVKERRIEVEETDTEVRVTVRQVMTGDTCDAMAYPGHVEVPLNDRLGDRPVIDGKTGDEVDPYFHASTEDS